MADEIKVGGSDRPYHNAETEKIAIEREAALNEPAEIEADMPAAE